MTKTTQPAFELFIGLDIAAKTALAAFYRPEQEDKPSQTFSFNQDDFGFAALLDQIKPLAPTLVPSQVLILMEATGPYHLELASFLSEAGYWVAVLNPAAVAHWIKSQLTRTKTDKTDALHLAKMAAERRPPRWSPPPAIYEQLHQRLVQRAQLVGLRTQTKNQLHALKANPAALPELVQQLEGVIEYLNTQITSLQKDLKTLTKQEHEWVTSISLLQTIPGIGLLSACLLVAVYRNFSATPSPEAAVQYAGLAPNERSSGTSVRGYVGIGGGGRAELRQQLYMAALTATRAGSFLHAYYQRLVTQEKKPPKVALIAVARKLVRLAYTIVKKQKGFDSTIYQQRWAERQAPKTSVA